MPNSDDMSKGDPEEVMAKMLETVKGVAVLLDAKATPDEAAGFNQWLFNVTKAVSERPKKVDFLVWAANE